MTHILDLRAAPAVDRLIVVSDHEQLIPVAGKQAHQGILQRIGVLELIDQNMSEALLVVGASGVIVAQKFEGAQQQLGEIDQPRSFAVVLVKAVDCDLLGLKGVVEAFDAVGTTPFFLVVVDEALHLTGREFAFIDFCIADNATYQTILVIGVKNLESFG